MFARLNLCAVEFILAAARRLGRSRVEGLPLAVAASPLNSAALPPFPTRANKKKPPATQATVRAIRNI